ncbi:MAG: ABC transporter ATP-binding protein [Rikenellaceae bacterium]|nr:ABC transporter ATP-binding protein [Rikenellaceae bacterium]
MIELRNITLGYGSRTLIEDATTLFECGSMVALLGRNGTGKSTLLRALAALGDVQQGEIYIDRRPLAELSRGELSRLVAFVTTERIDVEALTAYDLVAIGRSPYTNWMGRLSDDDRVAIERAMQIAGVAHMAERRVETMSDGECQRVMIARALAQDTRVILLDEPTAFLDLPNRYELCTLLSRLAHDEGKCVIFSTHELDIALSLADSIALVDTPHLVHLATPQMIASGNIERLFDSDYVSFDADTQSIRLRR